MIEFHFLRCNFLQHKKSYKFVVVLLYFHKVFIIKDQYDHELFTHIIPCVNKFSALNIQ